MHNLETDCVTEIGTGGSGVDETLKHALGHQHYQNATQCEVLGSNEAYHYVFNETACGCFFEFRISLPVCAGEDEYLNPFYTSEKPCITRAEIDAIWTHDL